MTPDEALHVAQCSNDAVVRDRHAGAQMQFLEIRERPQSLQPCNMLWQRQHAGCTRHTKSLQPRCRFPASGSTTGSNQESEPDAKQGLTSARLCMKLKSTLFELSRAQATLAGPTKSASASGCPGYSGRNQAISGSEWRKPINLTCAKAEHPGMTATGLSHCSQTAQLQGSGTASPALETVELLTRVSSRRDVSRASDSKPRRVMFWMTCVDRSITLTCATSSRVRHQVVAPPDMPSDTGPPRPL